MESLDLVVIGAGWSGLVAAKTYLEVKPSSKVVILDSESSVGGVWTKHRLYKGLKSNNMLGTYEYSDFPMDESTFDVKPGEHIPGNVLLLYFEKYVAHFQLADKIRLGSKVERAERKPDGKWRLTIRKIHGGAVEGVVLETSKLVVATGLTTEPFLPAFNGQDSFNAPLFHFRDFAIYEDEALQVGKRVAILGGTKSAWDVAYACATSGAQVNWIIRESGHGPAWMAPPYVSPLKRWLEKLVTTRFFTWFSPCIWGDADGFGIVRYFLHGTWLGRKMVDVFWKTIANDVIQLNGYDIHPEVGKLKPWVSPFWTGTSLGILNYSTNFFDYVKNGTIKIHITDIDHLSHRTIHLTTGEGIPVSAFVCATGWKATPNIEFLPRGIDKELGFAWSPDPIDEDLVKRADDEILRRFPHLQDQPAFSPKHQALAENAAAASPHPIRLIRFMVPLSMFKERSIIFLGTPLTINTALVSQLQALWATAYFDDKLITPFMVRRPLPGSIEDTDRKPIKKSDPDLKWETALQTQFGKWRYPAGFGKRNPDFVFDAMPYMDMLLKDLGLQSHRKSNIFTECFEPYGPSDYRGLVDEWKARNLVKTKSD
ncbi:hypothetical protein Egran_03098 [Elaphomyces granulatus]|uniref:FAD/NAD(P)-binding domain-containing protein n=1 Tax=Elaphomyces granulatus TaxID=519963 RepID=A0A232LYB8_9EURO|nr:hypothetical protein Egran_03098 [Elaphomyces granulatus]